MKRNKNISKVLTGGSSVDLQAQIERFVKWHPISSEELLLFNDIDLKQLALDSKVISEKTALHKVLYYFAYEELYLRLFDDLDWVVELDEYVCYVSGMFHEMGIIVSCNLHEQINADVCKFKSQYSQTFIKGLDAVVTSVFGFIWQRKNLLSEFNQKLSDEIKVLRKVDHPDLEKDGQILRATYFPQWLRDSLIDREKGKCHYCSTVVVGPAVPNQNYDIDHMIPIAKGGTNDPTNLVLACPECNSKKRDCIVEISDTYYWPKTH